MRLVPGKHGRRFRLPTPACGIERMAGKKKLNEQKRRGQQKNRPVGPETNHGPVSV
jgi:hypothetical protein